jgi:hypothetical protein
VKKWCVQTFFELYLSTKKKKKEKEKEKKRTNKNLKPLLGSIAMSST